MGGIYDNITTKHNIDICKIFPKILFDILAYIPPPHKLCVGNFNSGTVGEGVIFSPKILEAHLGDYPP